MTDLNNETWNEVFQGLSELPFNVLLKWDGESSPEIPSNVLAKKFFPQQDLLGKYEYYFILSL